MVKGLDWGLDGDGPGKANQEGGDGEGTEKKYKSGTGNWEKFSWIEPTGGPGGLTKK